MGTRFTNSLFPSSSSFRDLVQRRLTYSDACLVVTIGALGLWVHQHALGLPWSTVVGHGAICLLLLAASLYWRLGAGLLLVWILGSFLGCAADDRSTPRSDVLAGQTKHDELLQKIRTEMEVSRSDTAAARIAAAKKDAEIRELQREIATLRQTVQTKQVELSALREERNHLLQLKNDIQVQLAELPALTSRSNDAHALNEGLQRRLEELEATVAGMAAAFQDVKTQLAHALTKSEMVTPAARRQPSDNVAPLTGATKGGVKPKPGAVR